MDNLSIKCTGLLAILQSKPKLLNDAANLHAHFPENKEYIQDTLKKLEKNKRIVIVDNKIEIIDPLNITDFLEEKKETELETRIYKLFSVNRTYEKIAWFLDQIKTEKTFELDSELVDRVLLEYRAANTVQFWTDYHIEQALKRALVDKSKGNVTMKDLLDLLEKRDRGEIVWQK